MPPSAALIARNQRIIEKYIAGATIFELAVAEVLDPAIVRNVLRAADIRIDTVTMPVRRRAPCTAPKPRDPHLADREWLAAEYATKSADRIAAELGCPRHHVYQALRTADIPRHKNGIFPALAKPAHSENAERIAALYQAGWSTRRLAAEFGLSASRVRGMVRARGGMRSRSEASTLAHQMRREREGGESSPRTQVKWTSAMRAEVLERYAAGEGGEAIADALGLARSSVYRLLRKEGVLRRPGSRKPKPVPSPPKKPVSAKQERAETARQAPVVLTAELEDQVLERYAAGESPCAIGAVLDVAGCRIYRLLRERGVLRSRSEARRVVHAQRVERDRKAETAEWIGGHLVASESEGEQGGRAGS